MTQQNTFHGLWYKPTKAGKHRWSGKAKIGGVEYWVSLFQNDKLKDSSPDYSVTFNPVEPQQGHNQPAQGYNQPQGYQQPQQPQQYQTVNPGYFPQQPQQQGVFSQEENVPF